MLEECFNKCVRFGTFPEHSDQDYHPPEELEFDKLDCDFRFAFDADVSTKAWQKGKKEKDGKYVENHRCEKMASPDLVDPKSKDHKLLELLCFGHMTVLIPSKFTKLPKLYVFCCLFVLFAFVSLI